MWSKTEIPIIHYKTVKTNMVKLVDTYKKIKQKIHKNSIKGDSTELKFRVWTSSGNQHPRFIKGNEF